MHLKGGSFYEIFFSQIIERWLERGIQKSLVVYLIKYCKLKFSTSKTIYKGNVKNRQHQKFYVWNFQINFSYQILEQLLLPIMIFHFTVTVGLRGKIFPLCNSKISVKERNKHKSSFEDWWVCWLCRLQCMRHPI